MTRLNQHGTELGRLEYTDCRIALMSDGAILRNDGTGWKRWKHMKTGVDPAAYVAKALAAYDARPAGFHAYIRALVAACDLAHRSQLNALVGQMPDDPDAVCSFLDYAGCEPRMEDVARCCSARLAVDAASYKLAA